MHRLYLLLINPLFLIPCALLAEEIGPRLGLNTILILADGKAGQRHTDDWS